MKQILVTILNSLKSMIVGLFKRSKNEVKVNIDFDQDGKDDVTIQVKQTSMKVGKEIGYVKSTDKPNNKSSS